MYYNHPIHGAPSPEEVAEFSKHCRDSQWQCSGCGRWHPEYHKACWHCKPTSMKEHRVEDSLRKQGVDIEAFDKMIAQTVKEGKAKLKEAEGKEDITNV